ncbi:SDR family oxidoreductase [Terrarubrum flagellatum]|uniref:SDR family oxidoreductase n=1 Tax=Terrirubrum flagellatum TaxID=2895980 RepID=UPI003144F0E9
MTLAGQTIVVAGASSGMGRATALMAAEAGADLVLIARSADALAAVAGEIQERRKDAKAWAIVADAGDADAAARAIDEAHQRAGRIDALVNSVGTNIARRALGELTSESWRDMVAANLDAAFNLTRAIVPHFRGAGGGLLIHVSSIAARRADRSGVAYQATKAGVVALAHGTMEEEREHGVRVTAILPGMTDTPLLDKRPTPPTPEMRRNALQPSDVAAACLFVLGLPPRAHVSEILLQPSRG